MRKLVLVLLLLGCHPQPTPPNPPPGPEPEASACAVMCQRIGPENLNCEEGEAVYDSDLPGPPGVPNQSCTDFCERQQKNGLNLYPQCVAQVQSCGEIEPARQRCEQ
jgi:hypothetical protein